MNVYQEILIPNINAFPPPYLKVLVPDSNLPSTTGDFILYGSFFTKNMTVVIEGQTINYVTFISDNEVRVNITTGAIEGSFDVTLNNGSESIYVDALLIVLGTVYEPVQANWNNVTLLDVSENGSTKVQTYGSSSGTATWNQFFDKTKDWELRLNPKASPLGFYVGGNDYNTPVFELIKVSDSTSVIRGQKYYSSTISTPEPSVRTQIYTPDESWKTAVSNDYNTWATQPIILRYINGTLYCYVDGAVVYTFTYTIVDDFYLRVNNRYYDWEKIKYIELAT